MQPTPAPASHPYDLDEYKQLTALFQSYLTLAVTTLNFTFLMAGGVTAYVFSGKQGPADIAKIGLLVPAFICFAVGLGFIRAIPSSLELTTAMIAIKERLNLELAPHTGNLTKVLRWAGTFLLVMGVALLALFVSYAFHIIK